MVSHTFVTTSLLSSATGEQTLFTLPVMYITERIMVFLFFSSVTYGTENIYASFSFAEGVQRKNKTKNVCSVKHKSCACMCPLNLSN